MPAAEPLPTVQQLVNAYQGALVSGRAHGDTHPGSTHDHWAGLGAILFRQQAERDQQEFQALYFNSARGVRLDDYMDRRYPDKPRVTDARGAGTVLLTRPNASAGAGTFWEGTRVAVGGTTGQPFAHYLVDGNQSCGASDVRKTLSVKADSVGPGSKIHVVAGDRPVLRVEDPLWDNTWSVAELVCGEGTLKEDDDVYRPRVRGELVEERFGYETAIIKRMRQAGAETVVLFRSDFLGENLDYGLNRIYVGDSNFETSAALLRACRLAAPDVVIAGASNQVLAMTTQLLSFAVTIRFWDAPEKFGMEASEQLAKAAVVEYFETRENPFAWDLAGLRGAIQRAVEDTQASEITPSSAPPVIATLFNAYPLPRFRTTPERVTVTLALPA